MEKSNLTRFDRWKIHYIPHGEQRLTKYDYEKQEYCFIDAVFFEQINESLWMELVHKVGRNPVV